MIDSHAHLQDSRLIDDLDRHINDMKDVGVIHALIASYDLASSIKASEMSEEYTELYSAIGVHPHDAKSYSSDIETELKLLCDRRRLIAYGEIGLDYYYDLSPRDVQKDVFVRQLELAHSLSLPVILHIRDAFKDSLDILAANRHLLEKSGIVHCYSGSVESAKILLDMGFYIAFGGAITYPSNKTAPEVIKYLPHDKLLLETDCPYLAPVPYRGKTNSPKYVPLVAEKAAEFLSLDIETLEHITDQNFRKLFKLD